MKTLANITMIATLLTIPAAASAGGGGGSGTINYRATATFSDGSTADRLYSVTGGDLDGDGGADEVWLRVACDGSGKASALVYHEVKSPRDASSGMASGKRMHRPFKIFAQLDRTAASGQPVSWDIKEAKGAKGTPSPGRPQYDVKKVEGTGARAAAPDGKTEGVDDWQEATLRDGSPDLCK